MHCHWAHSQPTLLIHGLYCLLANLVDYFLPFVHLFLMHYNRQIGKRIKANVMFGHYILMIILFSYSVAIFKSGKLQGKSILMEYLHFKGVLSIGQIWIGSYQNSNSKSDLLELIRILRDWVFFTR